MERFNHDDPTRLNLVKAAALIIRQIERLDRIEAAKKPHKTAEDAA